MKLGLVLLAMVVFVVGITLAPIDVPPYLDFQVLYHADLGLMHGIRLYDHAGQVSLIAQMAHVSPDHVYVLPFPYPPWYALSTLWLAWLPIQAAARLWLALNLLMLMVSAWLITDGWPPLKRLVSFVFAAVFPAALGGLFVGQYDFPVLLGAAWMAFALPRGKRAQVGIAAGLLTCKPHLGLPIILLVAAYLLLRRDAFGRDALKAIGMAGLILFAVGFLGSPFWPLDYFHSLTGYRQGIAQCQQCNNASMHLADWLGGGFAQVLWFTALLLIVLAAWLLWQRRELFLRPGWLVSAAVLTTLLASPYLLNYDYLLLLIPLLLVAGAARPLEWIGWGVAYILPAAGLAGVFGASGNLTFVFSAVVLIALQTVCLRHPAARIAPATSGAA